MDEYWDIAIVMVALFGSIILAAMLLMRVRNRAKPQPDAGKPPVPTTVSRRQRRIVEKLEPIPEIPTLMDLVRQEISELGIEQIPGADKISDPVALKVYKRDSAVRERCTHKDIRFVVTRGVEPVEAHDDDVALYCPQCSEEPTDDENPGTRAER